MCCLGFTIMARFARLLTNAASKSRRMKYVSANACFLLISVCTSFFSVCEKERQRRAITRAINKLLLLSGMRTLFCLWKDNRVPRIKVCGEMRVYKAARLCIPYEFKLQDIGKRRKIVGRVNNYSDKLYIFSRMSRC